MPHLRQHGYTWNDHARKVGGEATACFAFCAVLLIVSALTLVFVTASKDGDYNTVATARKEIIKTVNHGKTPAERRDLAFSLVTLDDSKVMSTVDEATTTTQQQAKLVGALKKVAKTGQPLVLDKLAPFNGWHIFWCRLMVLAVGSDFLLLMVLKFFIYAMNTEDDDEYLMDFEWRRVWPIFFVAFTSLPIGLPFYIVSWFRVMKAKRNQARIQAGFAPIAVNEAAVQPVLYDDDEDDYRDYDEDGFYVRRTTPQRTEQVQFTSAPNAAKAQYVVLREDFWRQHVTHKLNSLRDRKEDLEKTLRHLGGKIKEMQLGRNQVIAELRQYESIDPKTAEIPDREHLDAEFERLTSLPGVAGIRVVNDGISLLVKPRIEVDGVWYDGGDWELRFGTSTHLLSRRLRSGIRPDWRGGYPEYRLGSGEFCFGALYGTINENLRKGQFLEAAELAVNCMHTINPDDVHNVPRALKRAPEPVNDEQKGMITL